MYEELTGEKRFHHGRLYFLSKVGGEVLKTQRMK